MKITPRAVLDGHARAEYQRKFGDVAPVKVRNARAPLALGEHRALMWRGHKYRVAPVSWRDGFSLLVVREVLEGDPTEEAELRAVLSGRRVLASLMRRRFYMPSPRAATREEVYLLAGHMIALPDESPQLPAGRGTVDLLDGLATFVHTLPAWCGPDGLPLSWAHYVYGLRYTGRLAARELLRSAQAARIAQDPEGKEFKAFSREVGSLAYG